CLSLILITGANRGLGFEMVRQLVEGPCKPRNVFAACRNPDGAQAELKLCDQNTIFQNIPFIFALADATDPSSIQESAKVVGSKLKGRGLNVLVNNAGVMAAGNMEDTTDDNMLSAFSTNVMGPMNVIKGFLPYLRTAAKSCDKPGMSCCKAAVINISTALGSMSSIPQLYSVFPAFSYSISKAGLNMLTVCCSLDLKEDGILCTALHPGWVRTDTGGPQVTRSAVRDSGHDITQPQAVWTVCLSTLPPDSAPLIYESKMLNLLMISDGL
uniref:Zgc:92161 n=1 Tax=Astyanax mexicanus TaxID=7994 RepID=A0A8B9GQ66_ASTMX